MAYSLAYFLATSTTAKPNQGAVKALLLLAAAKIITRASAKSANYHLKMG